MASVGNGHQQDIHICGGCRSQFTDIELFIEHKRSCGHSNTPIQNTSSSLLIPVLKDLLQIASEARDNHAESAFSPNCSVDLGNDSTGHQQEEVVLQSQNDLSEDQGTMPSTHNLTTLSQAETVSTNSPVYFISNTIANAASIPDAGPLPDGDMTVSVQVPTPDAQDRLNDVTDGTMTNGSCKVQMKFTHLNVQGIKRYKCGHNDCNFTTSYMKDLERHFRIHTGEKPFSCWQCGKRFSRYDKMKTHEKWHLGEKPHKCNLCDYAAGDKSSLKKHLRIHTDERPFKCQVCTYASRTSSQLVVHLRTHTGDTPFHCNFCSMKFKINSDLKRHMRMHTGEKPFSCSLCDYRCSIKGNLKSHKRLNHCTEGVIKCNQCNFTTASRKVLRDHERTHVVKPLTCRSCAYSTDKATALKIHERVHSQDKPFKCEQCPYTSRQSGNVVTHFKRMHAVTAAKEAAKNTKSKKRNGVEKEGRKRTKPTCVKSFTCSFCDASFVREDSLRSHVKQHQDKREEPMAQAMLELHSAPATDFVLSEEQSASQCPPVEAETVAVENGDSTLPATDVDICEEPTDKDDPSLVKTELLQEAMAESFQAESVLSAEVVGEAGLLKNDVSSFSQLVHQISPGVSLITIPLKMAVASNQEPSAFLGPNVAQPTLLRLINGLSGGVPCVVYHSSVQPSQSPKNIQLEMAGVPLCGSGNVTSILQPVTTCLNVGTSTSMTTSVQSAPTQVLVTSPLISQGGFHVQGLNLQSPGSMTNVVDPNSDTTISLQ